MKLLCKVCGRSAESEYCFQHKPRKKLLSFPKLLPIESNKAIEMHLLFDDIWNKKSHKSEISGEYLGKEPSTVYFHHILPKEKYPEAKFDEENIILLTFDEHNNVENDMYKYEKINKKREQLKIKYKL
jgi:hypothetical protein